MAVPSLVLVLALLSRVSASWDISSEFTLLEVGNTRLVGAPQCQAASVFAVIGALEIAQERITGQQIKFSEQELIDCHHHGCAAGHVEDYVKWLEVQDRLAPEPGYTGYRSKAYSCRAGMAPDAMSRIRVTGYSSIAEPEFEDAIQRHGSVLACIDTSSENCPTYRDYEDSIIDGYPSDECSHWVLIVGYSDNYYTVRNSYGADWGEDGYFRILRGGNKCGIEANMAVMLTEERNNTKPIDALTGCPEDYPKFCTNSKTCRADDQECQEIDEREMVAQQQEDVERGRTVYRHPTKRNAEELSCEDVPNMRCERLEQYCKYKNVQKVCGGTCNVCENVCLDREDFTGQCLQLAHFCQYSAPVKAKCAVTCRLDPRDCGSLSDQIKVLVKYDSPPLGKCYSPVIEHGGVANQEMLSAGEKLYIVCDEGYVLAGEDSFCAIQNLYSPDSRRVQTCIASNGEQFTGRGVDYSGVRDTTLAGTECANWQELADRGHFMDVAEALGFLAHGNNNFCRNAGGEDRAPYCIVHGYKHYCFALPSCGGDVCSGADEDAYQYCDTYPAEKCHLSDENANKRVDWYWDNCKGMCCTASGC